jgi:phage antirepressor YoqD-like protein
MDFKQIHKDNKAKLVTFVQDNPDITIGDIARMVGVGTSTLHLWLSAAGTPHRKRGKKPRKVVSQ